MSAADPSTAERVPLVTFDEALAIGRELHDHWLHMAETAPLERDDMAWGDVVQFVLRKAHEAASERAGDESR